MKINSLLILSLVTVLAIGLTFMSGCVSKTYTPNEPLPKRGVEIEKISGFLVTSDTNGLKIRFKLTDKEDEDIRADGTIIVEIVSENGEKVYSHRFNVKAEDFTYKGYLVAGGVVYEYFVPFSNIKKGASSRGKANLGFITTDGKSFFGEADLYSLPQYTEEEITQIYEADYARTASMVNKLISLNGFDIEVVRAGKYSALKHVTFGEKINYTRIDLKATNRGFEKEYFYPRSSSVIIVGNKQYKPVYSSVGSEFDGGEIYPGITQEGAIFFDELDVTNFRLIIERGYSNPDSYKFDINLKT